MKTIKTTGDHCVINGKKGQHKYQKATIVRHVGKRLAYEIRRSSHLFGQQRIHLYGVMNGQYINVWATSVRLAKVKARRESQT